MNDLDALIRRLNDKEDVLDADVKELLASEDATCRQAALVALIRTHVRKALSLTVDLASEQQFTDQGTLTAFQNLSALSDTQIPVVEFLKRFGLSCVERGNFEDAMRYLQEAVNKAGAIGQIQDARSRTAMRYLHDREIDEALEKLSSGFSELPGLRDAAGTRRLALLVSALIDENAPSIVALRYAESFRELGFDVSVISTEYAPSKGSRALQRFFDSGFPVVLTPQGTFQSRIQYLRDWFKANPVHFVYYVITPMDHVGKLLACAGVAPVQTLEGFAYEPYTGKYAYIAQGVSKEQEVNTLWPGRSRFVGAGVAQAREIDAASPMPRASIGVPEDALMLSTFGRIEKCISQEYLNALSRILRSEPRAVLVLAGPGSQEHLDQVMSAFKSAGVAERVRYIGRRQDDGPALLKTTDLYCDTYPWPGGQSLLDAMQAGCAIVAMKPRIDPDLDPTGCGCTTSTAQSLLDPSAPIADAGDVAGYAEIAHRYLRDGTLRAAAGERARQRAIGEHSFAKRVQRLAHLFDEALDRVVADASSPARIQPTT